MINLPKKRYYIIRYHSLFMKKMNIIGLKMKRYKNEMVGFYVKNMIYILNVIKIDEVKARKYYNNIVNKYFPKYIIKF